MFPTAPDTDSVDERGLFVVQDPILRSKILPLFTFDPTVADNRPIGHGTTFRIDPWSRCVTAFHILEDVLDLRSIKERQDGRVSFNTKSNVSLIALEMNGVFFGRVRVPDNAWRPIADQYIIFKIERSPLMYLDARNLLELAVLRIRPSVMGPKGTPYLSVDLSNWRPTIGERILALGYADLDAREEGDADDRPIAQYLYGSYAEITHVEPANGNSTRPWPRFRVKATWPGGMSGGPVFNEAGHVIGLVSSGFDSVDESTAMFFSGWAFPRQSLGSIDPNNPGWFRCHAAFHSNGNIAAFGDNRDEISQIGRKKQLTDFAMASVNPITRSHIRLSEYR